MSLKDMSCIKIGELFKYSVDRNIEGVVKVEDEDLRRVSQELDEYVLTPVLEKYYYEILDKYLACRKIETDKIGIWISGFFGSGKSHFTKILGYILENRRLGEFTASEKFLRRTEDKLIQADLTAVNNFLPTMVVMFQVKAQEDQLNPESISEIILRQFHKKLGYSEVPWIAELEKTLEREGKFNIFRENIKEDVGKEWAEARKDYLFIRGDIARALQRTFPQKYQTTEQAEKGLEDLKAETKLSPDILAGKLIEYLRLKDKANDGKPQRLFVLLDEVGQFVAGNDQKLLELQSIVEELGRQGKGRVWLVATAQEKLDDVVAGMRAKKAEFSKILGRFDTKPDLTSENIDMVIGERVLKKKTDKEAILKKTYREFEGSLNSATRFENPSRPLPILDEQKFVQLYPFIPYQLKIIQDIFTNIRSKGGGEMHLTGRERSMLAATQGVFIHAPALLKERSIGALVTLDMIYNEIEPELEGDTVRTIKEAEQIDRTQGELILRTLKTLYLLQNLGYIPRSLENIASLMYDNVGTEFSELAKRISKALDTLVNARLVSKTTEGYKFLTAAEIKLEEKIAAIVVKPSDVRREMRRILPTVMDIGRVLYEGVQFFETKVFLDDEQKTTKGEISFKVHSPIALEYGDVSAEKTRDLSLGDTKTIFWLADDAHQLSEYISSYIRISSVLEKERSKQPSSEERELTREKEKELNDLLNVILSFVRKSFYNGTIVYNGREDVLDGKRENINTIFVEAVKRIIPHVYPYFEKAKVKVDEDNLEEVFQRSFSSLSPVFAELSLFDDQKHVNQSAPVISEVLAEIKNRVNFGKSTTGGELIDFFSASPYGWNHLVIRLALACLFRNGNVEAVYEQKPYSDYSEIGAIELFTNSRKFAKTTFTESMALSPQERIRAREIVDHLFDVRPDDSVESIFATIRSSITMTQKDVASLRQTVLHYKLPLSDEIEKVSALLETLSKMLNSTKAIKKLLEQEDQLSDLLDVVKKLKNFEARDHPDEYRNIRSFIAEIWPQVRTSFPDIATAANESTIEDLDASMKSKKFLERWIDIKTDFAKVLESYVSKYKELHRKRTEIFENLLEQLSKNEVISELEPKDKERVFSTIKSKTCKGELATGAFTCEKCSSSLPQLQENVDAAESFKRRALQDAMSILEKQDVERKLPKIKTVSLSSLISSSRIDTEGDIERVLTELKTQLEKIMKEGYKIVVE